MTTHAGSHGNALHPEDPRELGSYRLLGRLGRGGMGTVLLGQDAAGRRVAVKVINRELAGEAAFRERFRREVTAARQVRRFCTAPVLDAELDRDPLYVVTEFIEGPSLERAVAERGPLPGSDLEGLAVGVATALAAIHGAGIVHRDLKPANVLLSATGPRVIDFGIARALDAVDGPTRTGQFVGTPSYLPPELLRGEPVTPASDIFSWGCVIAYAGTGRAPFAGATLPEILYKVAHEEPRLDGLDPMLRGLVTAALDKDPRNRPTTGDLLARLVGQEQPDPARLAETVQAAWHGPAHLAAASVPPGGSPGGAHVVPGRPDEAARPSPNGGTHALPDGPGGIAHPSPGGSGEPTRADHVSPRTGRRRGPVLGGVAVLAAAALAAGAAAWFTLRPGDGAPKTSELPTMLLDDNFNDPQSGWDQGVFKDRYKDGYYTLPVDSVIDTSKASQTPVPAEKLPESIVAEVKVRVDSEGAQAEGGLYCGREDLWYELLLRRDGTARIRKVTKDRGLEIGTAGKATIDPKAFNRVTARCAQGEDRMTLTLWVNGKRMAEVTDHDRPPLPVDRIGLVAGRPSTKDPTLVARFDDYVLGGEGK
ncbi:Serine/threonine protein kinase [Thermomonospora echinospora]|uniref:Serine/threonine protein kinase n=1 Tax=Thermomonospora echinospora TaxID=1992 RepID=A0A1H6B5B8_9ACTN|nr:serine/threonine-protein kinase [Thermomonospora echinospora]SEG56028.1 Serine/threonine protein kinase [Thermomonospora echinospora]